MRFLSSLVLISVLFVASLLQASGAADPLSSKLDGLIFKAQLKSGFHFNSEAPNSMVVDGETRKAQSIQPTEIVFTLRASKFKSATAHLFMCDDALTFCQPREIHLGAKSTAVAPSGPSSSEVHRNPFGFIEDNLPAALALAAQKHLVVLADFSARWCPGCVRLETDVFATREFKDLTAKWVTVRLDADRFENLPAMKKFEVEGIPTLIGLTAEGEEIARLSDYQPLPQITEFVQSVEKNPTSLSRLKDQMVAGDNQAAELIGKRLYGANRFEESIAFLSKVTPAPLELLDAQVQKTKRDMAKDPKQKESYKAALTQALKVESQSTRSIGWRTDLLKILEPVDPARKSLFAEGTKLCDDLAAHPEKLKAALLGDSVGEFAGHEDLMIAAARAELTEAATPDESLRLAAWAQAADLGLRAEIPLKAIGPNMRLLVFLNSAHRYVDAEKLADALLQAQPGNPEIERRLLRALNEQKKFARALKISPDCLKHSFGRNELWVVEQYAKALIGNQQLPAARKILQSYLRRADLDWTSAKAEHERLEALSKTLN